MKKFRFSLETVLRVKLQVEELRQRELAAAHADRDRVLAHLGASESALKRLNQDQAGSRGGHVDLAAETWFQHRHLGLSAMIAQARRVLREKEEVVEAARVRAVEAARERKVLEKLEEQQRLAHLQQSNREEQGFMDEMAQHALSAMAYPSPSVPR